MKIKEEVSPPGDKIVSAIFYISFRGVITPLSSSYNISGLVPVCWLLFQCF